MSTGTRPAGMTEARGYTARKLAPVIEIVERRVLLDGGVGVIAGTAFVDSSGSGQLDLTNPYLPGATIQLFQAGNPNPIATETTNAQGGYVFGGLAPGQYVVTEIPPPNYTATGTQVLSQFEPGSGFAPNGINVTIPASTVFDNYNGVLPGSFEVTNNVVDGMPVVNADGAFQVTLGTSKGATDLSSGFLSYCLNDLHSLSFEGGEQFQVIPEPMGALNNNGTPVSADHAGRVAFLYNHFGTSTLTSIQSAALQLAMWELIYDTGNVPDFSAGNFQVAGPVLPFTDQATLDQVLAQATAYYNLSAGKSEAAIFLDDSPNTGGGQTVGFQSMIATGSFNFANTPGGVSPDNSSSLSGFVYCDMNGDDQIDNGDTPLSGVTMALTGFDITGAQVSQVTQTDATGAYHFLNLNPGSYTIAELVPSGDTLPVITQGTPGTGTVGITSIDNIALGAFVGGQDNNFGEHGIPITVTDLNLYGIHHQPSRIVLQFSGPLNPASAQDTANYALLGLGEVQRLGSHTNHPIAISSAVYDPASNSVTLNPSEHLNIHYHYVLQLGVGTANPCVPPVTSVQVFGRAQVPVWTVHGRTIPAPPMSALEARNDQRIDADTLARLGQGPALDHLVPTASRVVSHALRPLHG